jgi:hypothetical protein
VRRWHSSRYDCLIDAAQKERAPHSMATKAWAHLDARVHRLRKSQRAAKDHEHREANPKFCDECGGGLYSPRSYKEGRCSECRGEA